MRRAVALLTALVAALALAAPALAHPHRTVPRGFFGVMVDGSALLNRSDAQLAHEFDVMEASGVETVRPVLYWADMQPDRQGPIDFDSSDRIFEQAAAHRMDVLPVMLRAPSWARIRPDNFASPPKHPRDYAAFLRGLIARYGPHGSFWHEHPELPYRPQRSWEVWNEPNLDRYWSSPQPFAKRFVKLVRVAHRAIKHADRGATVVLAAMGNDSWDALEQAYRAGLKGRWFDEAAVHPFTTTVRNVLRIVRFNHRVLAAHGNGRKPLVISEMTWPSAKGKTANHVGWETTEHGQAVRLRRVFRRFERLRRRFRLQSVIWSTWLTPDANSPNSFDWSGLRKLNPQDPSGEPISKPALKAYRKVALPAEGRSRRR